MRSLGAFEHGTDQSIARLLEERVPGLGVRTRDRVVEQPSRDAPPGGRDERGIGQESLDDGGVESKAPLLDVIVKVHARSIQRAGSWSTLAVPSTLPANGSLDAPAAVDRRARRDALRDLRANRRYEDQNDAASLRRDPAWKVACDRNADEDDAAA